jgi:hypothetical protein
LAEKYPYVGHANSCGYNKNEFRAQVDQIYNIAQDENAIKEYLYKYGPISVCFNTYRLQFYDHKSVFHPTDCPTMATHAGNERLF